MTTEPTERVRQEAQRVVDDHEEALIDTYPSHPWGERYRNSEARLVAALAAAFEADDAEADLVAASQASDVEAAERAAARLSESCRARSSALAALRRGVS